MKKIGKLKFYTRKEVFDKNKSKEFKKATNKELKKILD